MSFGLSNVLVSFQRYINKILAKKLDVFIIIYLDNILIYTEDASHTYIDAVYLVFEELRKYSFFANLNKCWFYNDKVRFLGYVVSAQGV